MAHHVQSLLCDPDMGGMDANLNLHFLPVPFLEGFRKQPCPLTTSHEEVFTDQNLPQFLVEIFENGNWSIANPSPECKCSSRQSRKMLPDCPEGAGGLPPPQVTYALLLLCCNYPLVILTFFNVV